MFGYGFLPYLLAIENITNCISIEATTRIHLVGSSAWCLTTFMQFIACSSTQTVLGTMISRAKTVLTFLNADL